MLGADMLGAEVYSCDDWEVKRAPFRVPVHEGIVKLSAAARLALLRGAGHRRVSIDLAAHQGALLRASRGKNGRSTYSPSGVKSACASALQL